MTFGERAAALAGLAARLMGWAPDEFWSATPAELAAAVGAEEGQFNPVAAHELAQLMARFPDKRN